MELIRSPSRICSSRDQLLRVELHVNDEGDKKSNVRLLEGTPVGDSVKIQRGYARCSFRAWGCVESHGNDGHRIF